MNVVEIFNYLKQGTYPEGATKSDKRKIRSRSKKYVLKNEALHWINRKGQMRQVPIKNDERQQILETFHDNKGHMGIEKTYYAICAEYYWRNLYEDVKEYVNSCHKCQVATPLEKNDVLHPIPVVKPWHHVCIDLLQMPLSRNGNRYILTVVDFFTKWPEAIPLRDKCAENVANELYRIFLRMGFPSIYSSDRGREFVNTILKSLMQKMNAKHRVSSAYHPQTNGLVERFNQTIQNMLQKACSTQDEWDEHLEEMTFAYRTMVQKTTRMTPFEVMFGRLPVCTGAVVNPRVESRKDLIRSLKEMKRVRDILQRTVKKNVKKSQEKQVLRHRAKRRKKEKRVLKIKDKVLLFNPRKLKKVGPKMESRWSGPYIITHISRNDMATLRSVNGVRLKTKYRLYLLKKYVLRNNRESQHGKKTLPDRFHRMNISRRRPRRTERPLREENQQENKGEKEEPVDVSETSASKKESTDHVVLDEHGAIDQYSEEDVFFNKECENAEHPTEMEEEKKPADSQEAVEDHLANSVNNRACSSEDSHELEMMGEERGTEQYFCPVDSTWQKQKIGIVDKNLSVRNFHKDKSEGEPLKTECKRVKMRGDGNCFFRCVSHAVTGSQMYHKKVRDAIVDWMERHDSIIQNQFGRRYLDESRMNTEGVWATEAEILSTASLLGTDIQILCKSPNLAWNKYRSEILGQRATTEKCIYLVNDSGVHFDYVNSM